MKCDLVEPKEQTIAHFLGGLKPKIDNVIQLDPYWTYGGMCKLTLKVEKQRKGLRGNGF